MAASCFPPLPVTTVTTTSSTVTTTTVRSTHHQITSSTYRSFRDVDDDEDGIAVLESIEIETVQPSLSWRERLRRSLRRRRRGKGNDTQTSTSMANANTTITMTTTLSEPRPLMTLARSQSDGHLPQGTLFRFFGEVLFAEYLSLLSHAILTHKLTDIRSPFYSIFKGVL